MARLNEEHKKKLISEAKKVYFAYLNLHHFNSSKNDSAKLMAFKENLKQKLLGDAEQFSLTLGKNQISVRVNKQDDHKEVSFELDSPPQNLTLKGINKYSSSEIAQHLTGKTFKVYEDGLDLKFSALIPSQGSFIEIGGLDKIDLHSVHISNLGRFIRHLESKKDSNNNMLVSLTTGSGKTFTQALFMLALHLAQVNGVFAIPESLLVQFKSDLPRLLPESVVETLEENGIIIDTVRNILSHQNLPNPANTVVSFDEAHKLIETERDFAQAKVLADEYINLYLTATPTPALEEMAQGASKKQKLTEVATMNNTQKIENGYAQPVTHTAIHVKSIADLAQEAHVPFSLKLQSKLADAIDPETGYDSGRALGEALLYRVKQKNLVKPGGGHSLRHAVRWNLKPSAYQGKTLICANEFNDLVNIDKLANALEKPLESFSSSKTPRFATDFYTQQNTFHRKETYTFLQMYEEGMQTPDEAIYTAHENHLYNNFSEQLKTEITQIATDLQLNTQENEIIALRNKITAGLAGSLLTNSAHGIIELCLSLLASKTDFKQPNLSSVIQNFGSIYLNEKRFNCLDELKDTLDATATEWLQDKDDLQNQLANFLTYHPESNQRGIAAESAQELAHIMYLFLFEFISNKNLELTDNWFADQSILQFENSDLTDALFQFAKKHYKTYVFNDIEKNENIPLKNVFTGFQEQELCLENNPAKARNKRAVEALNPDYKEYIQVPDLRPGCSKEEAENLFRLNLTCMVTDTLIAGYNDPQLTQVITMVPGSQNSIVDPVSIVQEEGRLRGQDPLSDPDYVMILQKEVQCVFGVDELNKKDFQKDYKKSCQKFKKGNLLILGKALGQDILKWIALNKNALHQVNEDKLADVIIEKCFASLEKLNKENAYHFKYTRKDFNKVIGHAIHYIHRQELIIKRGTHLPFVVQQLSKIMRFVARFLQYKAAKKPLHELKKISKELTEEDEDSRTAKLHYKIVKIPLSEVWQHDTHRKMILLNVMNEFKHLNTHRDRYYSRLFNDPTLFISAENKQTLKKKHGPFKRVIKGLSNVIALSSLESKESLVEGLKNYQVNKDVAQLYTCISNILKADLNPNHPDEALYLPRVQKMFKVLGLEIPKNSTEAQAYLREDLTRAKLGDVLYGEREALALLSIETEKIAFHKETFINALLEDIRKVIWDLLSDPAYQNMLQFIKKHFNNKELEVFTRFEPALAAEISNYIEDLCICKNPDEFIKKYFAPRNSSHELRSLDDIQTILIAQIDASLDMLFQTLHEANLFFYKVTAQGHVKNPERADQHFLKPADSNSIALKRMIQGYDVFLGPPSHPKSQAHLHRQSLLLEQDQHGSISLAQIDAAGNRLSFQANEDHTHLINLIQGWDLKNEDHTVKNVTLQLTEKQLDELNQGVQKLIIGDIQKPKEAPQPYEKEDVVGKKGRPLFLSTNRLNDENSKNGQTWRQILGLGTLKDALPLIDRLKYKRTAQELKAAKRAATMLKRIQGNKKSNSTTLGLVREASRFNHIMEKEAKTNPIASAADLKGYENRIQIMRKNFQQNKEQEVAFQIPTKPFIDLLESFIRKKRWSSSLFVKEGQFSCAQKLQRQIINRSIDGNINAYILLHLLNVRLAAYGKTACDDFTHLLQQIKDQVDTAFGKMQGCAGG